jgi:MoaA/NifB/PqqE/SkfB family radical SAM enzyme
MKKDFTYNSLLNLSINDFFHNTLKSTFENMGCGDYLAQAKTIQNKALEKRLKWEKQDLYVPPFMILSVTNQCNLACKGCYFYAQKRVTEKEMDGQMIRKILEEATEFGVSIIFIAGGEPMIRKDLLKITQQFTDIIFLIFSNGSLINDKTITELGKQRHVVPVLSFEGYKYETDNRRGLGIFECLKKVIEDMRKSRIFFGISLTVTRNNFHVIFNDDNIKRFIDDGCKIFFFIEYTPILKETKNLLITEQQKADITNFLSKFRLSYQALFVAFPGDEKKFGGCLGAGRGLFHISPDGAVELCPFAPLSDIHLKNFSLKEALGTSKLLRTVREKIDAFEKDSGGCVLWENRHKINSLLH